MPYKLNPFTGKFDYYGSIPQYTSDPSSPTQEDVWVNYSAGDGTPYGLLLTLTKQTGSASYTLKFRTEEDNTQSIAFD